MTESVKLDMATEVLASFGEARLPVTGSSMFPLMRPGDLLEIQRSNDPILAGEVVVFERCGKLVAHRVIECIGEALVTRGDRLRYADALIPASAVLGKVTAIQRSGRRINPALSYFDRLTAKVLQRTEFGTRAALYFVRIVQL